MKMCSEWPKFGAIVAVRLVPQEASSIQLGLFCATTLATLAHFLYTMQIADFPVADQTRIQIWHGGGFGIHTMPVVNLPAFAFCWLSKAG